MKVSKLFLASTALPLLLLPMQAPAAPSSRAAPLTLAQADPGELPPNARPRRQQNDEGGGGQPRGERPGRGGGGGGPDAQELRGPRGGGGGGGDGPAVRGPRGGGGADSEPASPRPRREQNPGADRPTPPSGTAPAEPRRGGPAEPARPQGRERGPAGADSPARPQAPAAREQETPTPRGAPDAQPRTRQNPADSAPNEPATRGQERRDQPPGRNRDNRDNNQPRQPDLGRSAPDAAPGRPRGTQDADRPRDPTAPDAATPRTRDGGAPRPADRSPTQTEAPAAPGTSAPSAQPAPGAAPAPNAPPAATRPLPPAQQQPTAQQPLAPRAAPAEQQALPPPVRPGQTDVTILPGARRATPEARREVDQFWQRGSIEDIRSQRRQRVEDGGRRVIIQEPDDRVIIREGNQYIIRHDETDRFRRAYSGSDFREERRGSENVTIIRRSDGSEIVTVRDEYGNLLRRVRREPAGREVILIENRRGDIGYRPGYGYVREDVVRLAPPVVRIPREEYIVETEGASQSQLVEAFTAPPVERVERAYTLDEVRQSQPLRERMRRVDVDTINFEFGSWQLANDQARALTGIAEALRQAIQRNPNEIFLVEGHSDAVGSDEDNLALSDRRAETVATILTQDFQIPAENLTSQGYGEQYLKVNTQEPSRENRRVTIRRITPLLQGQNTQQ